MEDNTRCLSLLLGMELGLLSLEEATGKLSSPGTGSRRSQDGKAVERPGAFLVGSFVVVS